MLKTFKGAPSLAYLVARRVCDTTRVSNCVIFVEGQMGSGKSTFSLHLGEEIAKQIAFIKHKMKGNPEDYFSIENVRTVERDGASELLTSDALLREHSIFVIDDARISMDSTKFQTKSNSVIRDIVTISRPFKSVIIVNSISVKHIDKGLRELCNILIRVIGANTKTKQTVVKTYKTEFTEKGEIKKFFTWTDKEGTKHRLVYFVGTLPSKKILTAYNLARIDNSRDLVMEAREAFTTGGISNKLKKAQKIDTRSQKSDEIAKSQSAEVKRMAKQGLSANKIQTELNLTPTAYRKALNLKEEP